jgi:hypothetical protein
MSDGAAKSAPLNHTSQAKGEERAFAAASDAPGIAQTPLLSHRT